MNVKIKNTNVSLSDNVSEYISKKISDVSRFVDNLDKDALCEVEVGRTTMHHKTGEVYRAEIHLHIKGEGIYVSTQEEDLLLAIDRVKDEAISRVKNLKDKKNTLYRRGRAKIKNMLKGLWRRD